MASDGTHTRTIATKTMTPSRAPALLLIALSSVDSFSIRPSPTSRIAPTKIQFRPRNNYVQPRASGPLFASGSGIIPYYDELMERMPSKKVLDVVDKARGSPIVASGKNCIYYYERLSLLFNSQ
jgi:hypothetical protein